MDQNPNFKVAITHDNQWMDMMKGGLTDEDLLHEDRLETFLAPRYTISVDSGSENTTVFLQGKTRGAAEAVSSVVDPCDSSPGFEFSPPPTPPLDNPWIVITRIRAQHIHSGFKRMPVGFYVLVQTDGDQRRTQNKSVRLNDSSIEWEDVILLPSKASGEVRFTVYASFELEPMLGNGEVLYTSEAPVEELLLPHYSLP
ncbi:hypothetical protein BKA83DRAFT_2489105 [Pisolithus microcarpus]|nr:hypothetical protein BKA83DRAFT_2489105 [Pisolithus microcarpus]